MRGGAPVAEVSSLTPGQIVSVSLPAVVASDGAPLTINITLTSAGNLTLSARGEAASSAVQLGEAPSGPVYIGGLPPGHSMAATYPSFRGCLHTVLVTGPASSRYLTFADTEPGERSGVEVDSEQCRAEAVPMVPPTQVELETNLREVSQSRIRTLPGEDIQHLFYKIHPGKQELIHDK